MAGRRRRLSRAVLDEWLPTLVRYVGIAGFVYAVAVDQGRNPALLPASVGLIFFKNVAGRGGGE